MTKPKITIFLLLAFIALGVLSCDKDDDVDNATRVYPYFTCKINGQNFGASPSWQCSPLTFNYYPNGFLQTPPGYTVLSGTYCPNYNSVGVRIYGFDPVIGEEINMLSHSRIDSCSPYVIGGFDLIFDSLISGNLNFHSFSDKQGDERGVVSGTFEFTVKNEELDSTVVVTDGKFLYTIDYEWY